MLDEHYPLQRKMMTSSSQPYLQPIIRGKQGKTVEFGAKISVSLTGKGLAHVDKLHWDAQHEGHDLQAQVEAYKKRYGYYPEVVIADKLYGSRDNRSYLERKHICFAGKLLGRPPESTPEESMVIGSTIFEPSALIRLPHGLIVSSWL